MALYKGEGGYRVYDSDTDYNAEKWARMDAAQAAIGKSDSSSSRSSKPSKIVLSEAAGIGTGNGYFEKEQYDEAIKAYTSAINVLKEKALKPGAFSESYAKNYVIALTNRASAYLNKNEYQQVIADYTEAIKTVEMPYTDTRMEDKLPDWYITRGDTYLNIGNEQAAIADYKKAVDAGRSALKGYCTYPGTVELSIKKALERTCKIKCVNGYTDRRSKYGVYERSTGRNPEGLPRPG